ncbi:CAIB/BAIF family enzyme [Aspergillus heteromorphus CBS 117.55]|uniref:CAIB/BAIF family enzyme n=1 Tax=Aspergillus heteromorphus CBS 117.55 TaxID=1448321 RepID=A0A317UYG1_9EURO|nr:CAIB/BAIF family enzyme [Aspergillus heteromorphus CBS 117.55]PWY65978.1 CAIB/BAIF family enzyme [Aspergillus heteromorphus CBS 117.55]
MTSPSKMYYPSKETGRIFDFLWQNSTSLDLPSQICIENVRFSTGSEQIYYPVPFKVTETLAALKGTEGALAAAFADLRFGRGCGSREVRINLERATLFGFQALVTKVNGHGRTDPEVNGHLKGELDTDIHAAQSNPYRRLAASMYQTKNENEFFHLHGSLNPTPTLNMIGLDGYSDDLTEYEDIRRAIESQVQKFDAAELETLNGSVKHAGLTVYTHEEFKNTPHGRANVHQPWWKCSRLPGNTPPTRFPVTKTQRILEGVKVLELTCVIAGPVIGRILAEYGADVVRITCPSVPDVPFFQVDGNMGKRTVDIDLKTTTGRRQFEDLLADADVLIDGYRPGVLERLGYGPATVAKIAESRGKGIIYVDENCFGHEGEWRDRPGWQQIADCLTGFARSYGEFLGRSEPIVSPLPIADYGAGCMGAIVALTGLYNRARYGGSYHGKVSLMQFNLLLFAVGQYPEPVKNQLRKALPSAFFEVQYSDSVDRSSRLAVAMMQERFPHLFVPPSTSPEEAHTETWYSRHFNGEVEVVRPVADVDGVDNSFLRGSRPNGADSVTSWENRFG